MFNKKFYSITGSLLVLVSLISLCFFVGTNNYKYAYGDEDSPIMIFNRSKNRFKEGTSTSTDLYSDYASAKTELGNDISFSYENFYMAKTSQSYWQLISANGSFTNFDQLSGLKTIDISLSSGSKDFTIYYSKDSITDITSSDVISYSYSGTDARVIFDFNNDEPNYFKFVNTGDSNFYITEMTLTYSCKDIYPLLSIYYSSSFGSVTGEGRHKVGSSVTVTATPKAGATFIGWYIWEDELISKEQTYTFDMYEEPITLYARFSANKYKINLICEDDGGTVTGGGTYDYYSNVEIQAFPKEGYGFKRLV